MTVSFQSIRFRLSVQYSAVVFGLGGGLLGLVYWLLQRDLQSQTMMAHIRTGQRIVLDSGELVVMPEFREVEVRAIESIYKEVVLNEVAQFTLIALIALFLLSIIVGWVMSGRVLKPVEEITNVAREIQASDLSRRIGLDGPDDELTRLADTFDSMLERLDSAFTAQRQFLADTSHDLRTPLTVIRSNVELVAADDGASLDDWSKAGGIIKRNAEKMSAMIDGLLAAARLQTGRARAVAVDLAALVKANASEIEPFAAEKGLDVQVSVSPTTVSGVEVSLDRALSNLVDNAYRAAPDGSVILLGAGVAAGWAWLGVQDSGPGLPENDDNRVGLGLSIVTQIAEAHGGTLSSFAGRDGIGTTMVIWLPLEEGAGDHPDTSPFTNL
ncbi:MAG: HAMP domain-containing sensor histidine kinase [Actinomycetota bacterium]|nr:HAMP domain-containing sensor histidine kinase [Actinomycetota bacterium]